MEELTEEHIDELLLKLSHEQSESFLDMIE